MADFIDSEAEESEVWWIFIILNVNYSNVLCKYLLYTFLYNWQEEEELTEKEKSKLKKMKAAAIDSDDEDEGIIIKLP